MASVFTRPKRTGFYSRIAVPRDLWPSYSTRSIVRKLTATSRRAAEIEARSIQVDFDRSFQEERSQSPLDAPGNDLKHLLRVIQADPAEEHSQDDLDTADELVIQQLNIHTDGSLSPEEDRLWAQHQAWKEGHQPYTIWIERRAETEGTRLTTQRNWHTYLGRLAKWAGTDYLSGLTRRDAIEFKEWLLKQTNEKTGKPNSPGYHKNHFKVYGAFWRWADDHQQVSDPTIWANLGRSIKEHHHDRILPDFAEADELAAEDLLYNIQRFTGCRGSEAAGLRGCDLDLEGRTIHFTEWKEGEMVRHLKGKSKDRRTVPMHSKIYSLLLKLYPGGLPNGSLFPKQYKPSEETWGDTYKEGVLRRYGIHSHDLRRRVVTQLSLSSSPFILYALTRHQIPGMSTGLPKSVISPSSLGWPRRQVPAFP
ncbi:tyrosine-type recombinase/integrase [Synechococcus sp. CBW1002]|uniref:tyrosine-type recombinase/integrase n=1 Tax=Synechococcus sp. CBW1002 TaxID=1353134 RepID=UPI0018CF1832|nr:tyrosine-type recombinase/integrase [Synechococcus sp. CBW1002]QPN59591.1 tyrosine-type recombinase/integrase [Synechococcus sp. CBW1002]